MRMVVVEDENPFLHDVMQMVKILSVGTKFRCR